MPSVSAIGPCFFVSMNRYPTDPQDGIDIETRPGLVGATAWKRGVHPRPITLDTFCDTVDRSDAIVEFARYLALVGAGPQRLQWGGYPWGYVIVQDVEAIEVSDSLGGVGGLRGTSRGFIRARWTVIPWVT